MNNEVYKLSGSAPEVSFNANLLKLTGTKMIQNELDLGMWVRMEWFDPRLNLFSCGKTEQLDPKRPGLNSLMCPKRLQSYCWARS